MSWWGTRIATVLAVTALLALAGVLSSCGGSDSGSGTTSAKTSGEAEAKSGGAGNSGGKSQHSESKADEGKERPAGSVPVGQLQVSGGGSAQFRVKGGDNSIQDFGDEASESELEAAAKALHDFYVARAREEWQRACANLSQTVAGQLKLLAGRTKQSGNADCPSALAAITPSLPAEVERETTAVDAGSLRVEGDRGFLIYRDGEGTVYAIVMADEGSWKAGALAGVPLQ